MKTIECDRLGSGICDGYSADGDECTCRCHVTHNLPSTVEGVRDWHDEYHDVVIIRQVREGLRPVVGDLVDE